MSKRMSPLTEVELEVMKAVWDLGEATVRQVHEAIEERRTIAYTTVLTMVGILVRKGHLVRKAAEGRAYLYAPARPKGRVISEMVDDFVGRVLQGSARALVLGLLKDRKISKAELREIARIVADGGKAEKVEKVR
jgi:BlaI family transcriptional regulator, penicillinase repressor